MAFTESIVEDATVNCFGKPITETFPFVREPLNY